MPRGGLFARGGRGDAGSAAKLVRVYTLAEQARVSVAEVLEHLYDLGFRGYTPSSLLDAELAAEVVRSLSTRTRAWVPRQREARPEMSG